MIKCDNGNAEIKGTNYEAMLDFNCIIDTLFDITPEIAIATFFVRADEFKKQASTCNKKNLMVATEICKAILKEVREHEQRYNK